MQLMAMLKRANLKVEGSDSWMWRSAEGGEFSIRNTYFLMQNLPQSEQQNLFDILWKAKVPSKVLVFAWRELLNRIQTKDQLKKRGIGGTNFINLCPICKEQQESTTHLLFNCSFAYACWLQCCLWICMQEPMPSTP